MDRAASRLLRRRRSGTRIQQILPLDWKATAALTSGVLVANLETKGQMKRFGVHGRKFARSRKETTPKVFYALRDDGNAVTGNNAR